MVHTLSRPRLTFSLALGLVAAGMLAVATPAMAQSGRFRVLVPRLERQGDISDKFGKQVAEEVQKLINDMPTHMPVSKGDLKAMLKKYDIDEDDLNCITSRQLAAQTGIELVMCGRYGETASGMNVTAQFVVAKDQLTFDVPAFTASEPKQAAQHIFSSFEAYVNQLSLAAYCQEDLGREDWNAALDKCGRALELNPTMPTALYGKGYALMKLEQLEPALEALEAVLETNPVHQEALLAAGFVTAKLGQNEASRDYYHQYLELNPGDAQVRLRIAIQAAQAGDPEGALIIAEQGLQGDSADLTLVEYAGYFAASAATKASEPMRGQNGSARQLTPEVVALYEKALDYLGRVFEAKGTEAQANVLVQRLNALTQLGRTAEAIDFGAKAVATKPEESQLWRGYASALKEAGRLEEAIAALDSVLAHDPEAQSVNALQGQWLVQADRREAGVAALRKAVDRNEIQSDDAARILFVYGYNEKAQKKMPDQAIPYYEAAAQFATVPQTKGMINFFTGFVLYNKGMQAQEPSTAASARAALPIFQRAIDLFRRPETAEYTKTVPSINLQQFVDGSQQYIEIQEALIKRGR